MKALLISIFIIIVIALLFFATQIIKSKDLLSVGESKRSVVVLSKTFIEIKRGINFKYPADWNLIDPNTIPGYAPVFRAEDNQFAGLGIETLKSFPDTDKEISEYSKKIPIQNAINAVVKKPVKIKITNSQKLSYPNTLSGFILDYSGYIAGQNEDEQVVKGKIYFYRTGESIVYAFSAGIINTTMPVNATSTPQGQVLVFIADADAVFKTLSIN